MCAIRLRGETTPRWESPDLVHEPSAPATRPTASDSASGWYRHAMPSYPPAWRRVGAAWVSCVASRSAGALPSLRLLPIDSISIKPSPTRRVALHLDQHRAGEAAGRLAHGVRSSWVCGGGSMADLGPRHVPLSSLFRVF